MRLRKTSFKHKHRSSAGFTLLEIVISLGMMGMLVGMIFRLASSTMQLSQTVVESQQETMERGAFFSLLKNHFEQIPGNAVMRLETYDSSGDGVSRKLFTLTFQNVPMSFNWGEYPVTAEAIQLVTEQQRDGFVDVVLKFYDVKIIDDPNDPVSADEDAEPFAAVTLIEDLWMFDCDVVDGSTMEPSQEWDNEGQLPLLVKFYCRFDPTADIVQQTCWVVPKQNTAVYFRELAQQGGQQNANGSQPTENPNTSPQGEGEN